MAVLTFYQQALMNQPVIWYGTVTVANSTQLSINNYAGQSGTYYGNNLTYNTTTVTGGIVTGYDSYQSYAPNFSARGANIDAVTLANLVNSGNVAGVNSLTLNGNDVINGSIFSDNLIAYSGNDLITGGRGNDFIDGGQGIDTASYQGLLSQYTGSVSTGVIVDTVSGRDGSDTLANIERLKFSDTMLAVDIAPTQNAGSVYMIYKAAFNRAPDNSGMGYWLAQKDAGSNIVTNIAQGFVNSAEFTAKYGTNPSNATYIDKLYQNVLGRSGDSGGIAYWNQQLDNGSVSKAAALAAFATLPEGASNVASLIANGIPYTEFVG